MGYRVRRIDSNQNAVVKKFRALGCIVLILSEIGRGAPDLLVAVPKYDVNINESIGNLLLVEIKDGSKPPSARKLTPDEQKFHDEWVGFVYIVNNEEDVQLLVDWVRSC
jgi:hypothetical protein